MKWLVLACLVSATVAGKQLTLGQKQLNGMKSLLKNLDQGVFCTCDLILFSELVDFDTAEKRCENFDIGTGTNMIGNLATVNDNTKNNDLKMLLGLAYTENKGKKGRWAPEQWVWAGLRKTKNNDGSKKSRKYVPEDWQWTDKSSPMDFASWMKKQPDGHKKGKHLQNQMRINHQGIWDDTFKYMIHPYACDYQGKYILSPTHRTWSDAKLRCEEAGLMLAKVRSGQEAEEMKKAADYFLGSWDPETKTWDHGNWVWLGGNDRDEEGTWKWIDGTDIKNFKEMNWRPPNPDNAEFVQRAGGQNALAFSKWGQFDDSYDDRRNKRPFACQCPGT